VTGRSIRAPQLAGIPWHGVTAVPACDTDSVAGLSGSLARGAGDAPFDAQRSYSSGGSGRIWPCLTRSTMSRTCSEVGDRVPAQDQKARFAASCRQPSLLRRGRSPAGWPPTTAEEGEVVEDAKAVQVHRLTHGGVAVVVAPRASRTPCSRRGGGCVRAAGRTACAGDCPVLPGRSRAPLPPS
jgi:hypothetical protein